MAGASSVGIRLLRVSAVFRHPERGDIPAVRDVDLEVRPGELLTLLGPSGCGKTTTLRMIAGFQEPTSGQIFIGEREVTHVPVNKRDIGFVFQSYALFPHLSVFENVAYGLRVRGMSGSEVRAAVTDVLALVGLEGFDRRQPSELSGGQQQRVALARAIIIRPRVLLFDEPLSNLDAKLRVEMRTEIQRLQGTLGITTLYVTHDQEEAMAISDRIAVMQDGSIAQLGTAEELYRRPASTFVAGFLGRANILYGVVREVVGNRMTLDVGGTMMRFKSPFSYTPGTKLGVVIRPEAISLGPSDESVSAEVVSRVYLGDKVEYVVRLAGQMLQVVRSDPPEAEIFAPGQDVSLSLPSEGVQLLSDNS
ncbi:MAG: ABC transporter ATP-binding protein [Proteobacteria bacterium]|nr:ABC transporter ATP-binding protein [Pseudomonadota bacterium]MBI3496481.1 ABC transporter ATP-binding protein [Pseudomonadota bacterium]